MYRHFDDDVEAWAKDWREKPIQRIKLQQLGPFTQSADGACLVAIHGGKRGYTKPRPGAPSLLVVGREKVASDLAYELGLPVPPVLVKPPCEVWADYRAVSLVSLPATRSWGNGGDAHRDRAAAALEGLRVFWTWIADSDHNGHPDNLLYEVAEDAVKLVAIDHSFSLGHGLNGDPLAMGAGIGYGTAHDPGAAAARADVVDKICALTDGTLGEIVRRLPDILTTSEQESILTLLDRRRQALPRLMAA